MGVKLEWKGGLFQAADLAGFRIYGSPGPAGTIDHTKPLATIAARPGETSGDYSWETDTLTPGTWNFEVVAYDTAGNEGGAQATSMEIPGPPNAPAPFPDGSRLRYVVEDEGKAPETLPRVTLRWNPPQENPPQE